ncbi:MAG TPA: universal stress protein [Geminicoccaceae bacterium]|nr:universal stress protein [Geminicoccus sp.]HMU48865.1 universal stress protein [Geminicoccaceae bacterium]
MSYKTILYVMSDDAANQRRLGVAKELAGRCGGSLVVLHVTQPAIIPVGFAEGTAYIPPEIIDAQQAAAAKVTERMKQIYRDVCEPETVPSRWRHEDGEVGAMANLAARAADLTVLGTMPTSGMDALAPTLVEQLALGAGGPVLVLPRDGVQSPPGRNVVLAWNNSRESARALQDGLGFLTAADRVTVAGLGSARDLYVDDVVARLQRHGVSAEAHVEADASDAGAALLRIASDRGADLLVMGAYGRARLRELILGGATRDVLRNAPISVMFSS